MKWPRPRFTVRRVMVAVAILAVLIRSTLWFVEMRTWSVEYNRRAFEFGLMTYKMSSGRLTSDGRWVCMYDDENDGFATHGPAS
jgi:hypothetical protein